MCLCVSLFLCVCLSAYLNLSLYHLYVYPFAYLPVCLFVCLPVCLTALYVCLSVCLPFCLPVCLVMYSDSGCACAINLDLVSCWVGMLKQYVSLHPFTSWLIWFAETHWRVSWYLQDGVTCLSICLSACQSMYCLSTSLYACLATCLSLWNPVLSHWSI